jgi:hypothetical protein
MDNGIAVSAECVVCTTPMTEFFHYPVRNECDCVTRICQSCRHRVHRCPTCRHYRVGTLVDGNYLENILLSIRGSHCQGCSRFIRSRHILQHNRDCPDLLKLRLQESMDDCISKEIEYRKVLREKDNLQLEINDMAYQIQILRQSYYRSTRPPTPPPPPPPPPPPYSDSDEESQDGEEIEMEVHQLPATQPPVART